MSANAEARLVETIYRCDQVAQVGRRVSSADLVRLLAVVEEVLRLRGER